jgi:hypothetical protein
LNETLTIILILLGVGAIVFIGWYSRRKTIQKAEQGTASRMPIDWPPSFAYKVDEPNTPFIQSVVPVPENVVKIATYAIQCGIRATNERFGWSGKATPFEYNIAFIDPTATNLDGSPALMVNQKNLEGKTIGSQQSAGTCIGVGNDKITPTNIVIPHQAATNWRYLNYLFWSIYNEFEHDRENHMDKNVFNQYLGLNDIHQHTPPQFPIDLPEGFAPGLILTPSEWPKCCLVISTGEYLVLTGRK